MLAALVPLNGMASTFWSDFDDGDTSDCKIRKRLNGSLCLLTPDCCKILNVFFFGKLQDIKLT